MLMFTLCHSFAWSHAVHYKLFENKTSSFCPAVHWEIQSHYCVCAEIRHKWGSVIKWHLRLHSCGPRTHHILCFLFALRSRPHVYGYLLKWKFSLWGFSQHFWVMENDAFWKCPQRCLSNVPHRTLKMFPQSWHFHSKLFKSNRVFNYHKHSYYL